MIRLLLSSVLCLLLVTVIGSKPANAISAELIEARKSFERAMDAGDFQSALPFAEDVVDLAEDEFPKYDPRTAAFQFDLAIIYGRVGKVSKAPGVLKDAIRILEKTDTPNTELLLASYSAIANAYTALRKHNLAWPYLEDKLALEEKIHGTNSLQLEGTLRDIAVAAVTTRKISQGIPFYIRISEIVALEHGRNHESYGEILIEIADMYDISGKKSQAEGYFMKALALFEENYAGDVRITQLHSRIGSFYASNGERQESGHFLAMARAAQGKFEATPVFTPLFSYAISRGEFLDHDFHTAEVEFTVTETGEVRNVVLLEATSGRLGRKLANAVLEWKFEPATGVSGPYETQETTRVVYESPYKISNFKPSRENISTRAGAGTRNPKFQPDESQE